MLNSNQSAKAVMNFCVFAFFVAGNANATDDYQCTIEKRINASPEPPTIQKAQEMAHVGKAFTVERATGIIAGALSNAFTSDPEIVDDGSTGSAYKVVSTIKQEEEHIYGSNIYALIVNEHEKSPHKTFVFMENDVMYLGRCKHTKLGR